jgi:hypothetical protein
MQHLEGSGTSVLYIGRTVLLKVKMGITRSRLRGCVLTAAASEEIEGLAVVNAGMKLLKH